MFSPPEHQFGVFILNVFIHQLQQQRPHNVCVILQLPVQRHRQEGGEISPRPGVKVRTALQCANKLERKKDYINNSFISIENNNKRISI